MPRPRIPASALEKAVRAPLHGVSRRASRRVPPTTPFTSLALAVQWTETPHHHPSTLLSSVSSATQPRQGSAGPSDEDNGSHGESGTHSGSAADETCGSLAAWLSATSSALQRLRDADDLSHSVTGTAPEPRTDKAPNSALVAACENFLGTLQQVARLSAQGKQHARSWQHQMGVGSTHDASSASGATVDEGLTTQVQQRVQELEDAVLVCLEWLKARFDAARGAEASTSLHSVSWPLKTELRLRCLVAASRTPTTDTCTSVALVMQPLMATRPLPASSAEGPLSQSFVLSWDSEKSALLFIAQTLTHCLHYPPPRSSSSSSSTSTKRSFKSTASTTDVSALPYLLFCLCAVTSPTPQQPNALFAITSHPPSADTVSKWQTNAADAFCAASSAELLIRMAEGTRAVSDGELGQAPQSSFPELLMTGVVDQAWSPRVRDHVARIAALESVSTAPGLGGAAPNTTSAPLAGATAEVDALEGILAHFAQRSGRCLYYASSYFTPYWSFTVSLMLREGWHAQADLDVAQDKQPSSARRHRGPKHESGTVRRKAPDRSHVFHAVGALLSFRRMVSAMHRHKRVLPILELHRVVTGTHLHTDDGAADGNAAFLAEAAGWRARRLRWSSGDLTASPSSSSSSPPPTSADALLWRETALFDAYTLTTVGHTSEAATDFLAAPLTRQAAITDVAALQARCLRYLLQLEAVEAGDVTTTTTATDNASSSDVVLHGTHPLLWSLLTPRTREELRNRLREALRLGTKFHLRVGDAAAVRDLYARCPSIGGSWEVGKVLLAAQHYAAALAAFQSLLLSLTATSASAPSPPALLLAGGKALSGSPELLGIPHVLRQWLIEAIIGDANAHLVRRFAALTGAAGQDEAGAVLLSDSSHSLHVGTTETAQIDETHPSELITHAKETAELLDQTFWSTVRDGCAPLPAAVCLHAVVQGILSDSHPTARDKGESPLSDRTQVANEDEEVATQDTNTTQRTTSTAERAYRLAVGAAWLARHLSTVAHQQHTTTRSSAGVVGEAEAEDVLADGLLRDSVEALLTSTLSFLDSVVLGTQFSDTTPEDPMTVLIASVLFMTWQTLARAVVTCTHLSLLAPCVRTLFRHGDDAHTTTTATTTDSNTFRWAALEDGLFTLLAAALDGVVSEDASQRLSDAYVLSCLAVLPHSTLSRLQSWCDAPSAAALFGTTNIPASTAVDARKGVEHAQSLTRRFSSRAQLLVHTAASAAAAETTAQSERGNTTTAAPHAITDGDSDLLMAPEAPSMSPRQPWLCVWCQTWNGRWSTTCKHCTASVVSLVQCGACGGFSTSSYSHCVVCQRELETSTATADGASPSTSPTPTPTAMVTATGASAHSQRFPLRAWTCHGCHSRNAPGHVFYCATCGSLKPELEPAIKATVFTCTSCQTVNPLGMLKPWCAACGALAPAIASPPAAAATDEVPTVDSSRCGPSLWCCVECGQLSPWTRTRCAACDGRRTPRSCACHDCHLDLVVPWCTLHCPACETPHPAWCWKDSCRACHAPLRGSTGSTHMRATVKAQWNSWQAWVVAAVPVPDMRTSSHQTTTATTTQDGATATGSFSLDRHADAYCDEVQTEWPAPKAGAPVKATGAATPPVTRPEPNLAVHVATTRGFVCWLCATAHAGTDMPSLSGAPKTQLADDKHKANVDAPTARIACASCHATHAMQSVLFVTFGAGGDNSRSKNSSTSAQESRDETSPSTASATVFSLAPAELARRTSGTGAARFGCKQCGASAVAIHPSGLCSACGHCILADLAPGASESSLSHDEWRVRLRLLLHDLTAIAQLLTPQSDEKTASATRSRTHAKKAKRKKQPLRNGHPKKHAEDAAGGQTARDDALARGLSSLSSGVRALRVAPHDTLPWSDASSAAVHQEALSQSRALLTALAHIASHPTHALQAGSVSETEWARRRPWLCVGLNLVDAWNDTVESDELGFDVLRALCLAIRPDESEHIAHDTRWQYLANMKLTRSEMVRGVACETCLSRSHKTGEVAGCGL